MPPEYITIEVHNQFTHTAHIAKRDREIYISPALDPDGDTKVDFGDGALWFDLDSLSRFAAALTKIATELSDRR